MRVYSDYTGEIDCKTGDKVYVYRRKVLDKDGKINESMIGVVEYFEQEPDEDVWGGYVLKYSVEIRMKDGSLIKIKDEDSQNTFFRKYEFITLRDLNKMFGVEVAT